MFCQGGLGWWRNGWGCWYWIELRILIKVYREKCDHRGERGVSS